MGYGKSTRDAVHRDTPVDFNRAPTRSASRAAAVIHFRGAASPAYIIDYWMVLLASAEAVLSTLALV